MCLPYESEDDCFNRLEEVFEKWRGNYIVIVDQNGRLQWSTTEKLKEERDVQNNRRNNL